MVFENLTLAGAMQAPGRPDKDPAAASPTATWADVQVRHPEADPGLASVAAASTVARRRRGT